jgi:monofunctional biosynthetic peptidoglycan transglycosylase
VHIERHMQAWIHHTPYHERYRFVPLSQISPNLQQLVKNLLLGTSRSILRKGAEFTLVPVAELVLGKQRILELYLNVVEWGPGIYGAEAACRAYDGTAPRNISREQAARLAAILPAPLKRRPERMNRYSALILERMRQVG